MGIIVENFDQFLQQASIAQTGDPRIFGLNPKKKKQKPAKSKPKPKSKQPK
jgi:hypothetical protein